MSLDVALTKETCARPKHILVVEDNVALRFTLSEWLRTHHYTVYEAATADEAKTLLASPIIVDLVITDVQMPGSLDGLGLVDHIRDVAPHLHVIVVSGNDDTRKIKEKCVTFLRKPYDLDAVALHAAKLLQTNPESPAHEQQQTARPT